MLFDHRGESGEAGRQLVVFGEVVSFQAVQVMNLIGELLDLVFQTSQFQLAGCQHLDCFWGGEQGNERLLQLIVLNLEFVSMQFALLSVESQFDNLVFFELNLFVSDPFDGLKWRTEGFHDNPPVSC